MNNKQIRRIWHKSIRNQIDFYKSILTNNVDVGIAEIKDMCYLCGTTTYIMNKSVKAVKGSCNMCVWKIYELRTCLDWIDKHSKGLYKETHAYGKLREHAIEGDDKAITIIKERIKMLEEWDKLIDDTDFKNIYNKLLEEE